MDTTKTVETPAAQMPLVQKSPVYISVGIFAACVCKLLKRVELEEYKIIITSHGRAVAVVRPVKQEDLVP